MANINEVRATGPRRAGAALAAAVLTGTALASAPLTAGAVDGAAESKGTETKAAESKGAASPLHGLVAAQDVQVDPNADGYDQFIVTYKEGASAAATEKGRAQAWGQAAREAGVSVQEKRQMATGARVVTADKKLQGEDAEAFMRQVEADPSVESVEPDVMMTINREDSSASPLLEPQDSLYDQLWGLHGENGMNVPPAWDKTTGEGATVAVLDTGIVSHPDLDPNVQGGYDFISRAEGARDGDGRDSDPQDEGDWFQGGECGSGTGSGSSWHGTHVAGTVAAATDSEGVVGVAPDATIQPVRVLGKCGGSLSDITDAIIWSAGGDVPGVPRNENPADVINMSLGGGGMCGSTYQQAIDFAVQQGTSVVVAAGNENQPAANVRPASCDNVITVGATDKSGNRSYFSNYGDAVDVAAPGGDTRTQGGGILSTVDTGQTSPQGPGHAEYQGTSMATPHVAGVAALMAAQGQLSPAEVEAKLKENARPIPGECPEGCGAGLVDAAATLGASDGTDPEPTPDPDPEPTPDPEPVDGVVTNGGFEQGTEGWTGNPADFVAEGDQALSGTHFAELNGQGRSNTAVIEQEIQVPEEGGQLSYNVQVDTEETTQYSERDTLRVQVKDGYFGTYTLGSHSNLDAGDYSSESVDLSNFAGKTVTLRFVGQEDYFDATTFRVDDVAVN
ncbi:serine protease [Micrococcus cohnii]|uniref:Serine protease n=1 Tax=Micrococcus cohnii TaxID=993416 RepID=A0A7W7DX24_9MICC|nr:S8 family peptidase [Micrococcus cohnii]MBB4734508.1 serine protease [Micrococcus cohnii]